VLVEQLRQRIVRMSLNYFDGETLYKQKESELVAALKECMQAMDECVSLLNINGVVTLPSTVTNVVEKYCHYSSSNVTSSTSSTSDKKRLKVKSPVPLTVGGGAPMSNPSPSGSGKRSQPGSGTGASPIQHNPHPNKKRRNSGSFSNNLPDENSTSATNSTTNLEEDVAAKLVAISSL